MKSVKAKESKRINWALPGKVTHEEFMAAIKKAEEGPFMTIEEFENKFEEWIRQKGL